MECTFTYQKTDVTNYIKDGVGIHFPNSNGPQYHIGHVRTNWQTKYPMTPG